jgi:hypothetical protein
MPSGVLLSVIQSIEPSVRGLCSTDPSTITLSPMIWMNSEQANSQDTDIIEKMLLYVYFNRHKREVIHKISNSTTEN